MNRTVPVLLSCVTLACIAASAHSALPEDRMAAIRAEYLNQTTIRLLLSPRGSAESFMDRVARWFGGRCTDAYEVISTQGEGPEDLEPGSLILHEYPCDGARNYDQDGVTLPWASINEDAPLIDAALRPGDLVNVRGRNWRLDNTHGQFAPLHPSPETPR